MLHLSHSGQRHVLGGLTIAPSLGALPSGLLGSWHERPPLSGVLAGVHMHWQQPEMTVGRLRRPMGSASYLMEG